MPDSPETHNQQKPDEKMSAFQRYLVEDQKLADQYQQVIDTFVEECRTQHPDMNAETEKALEHYFVTYIARGADPTLIDYKELGSKLPDAIKALEEQIPDKLSQPSRDRFAKLGEERGDDARWDQIFKTGDDIVISLPTEAKSLRERIDDVIATHNTEADKKYHTALLLKATSLNIVAEDIPEILKKNPQDIPATQRPLLNVGKDLSQTRVRMLEGTEQIEEYDRRKEKWKAGRKIGTFLNEGGHTKLLDEYNNLASSKESLLEAMRPPAQASNISIPYGETGTRADGYDPASMHVVISRDPHRIGESSSGQAWFSCMSEGGINFHYLDSDIKQGTLVAYLVSKDDPLARRPLARILLKPYTDPDTKETVLVPGKPYGGHDDYRAGRRETISPKVKAAFQEAVMGWVREMTHEGKKGSFSLRTGLYSDGELTTQTLKDSWTHDEVLEGLKGFRLGLIQEFLTEHYTKQQNVDALSVGTEKTDRQTELNAEYKRKIAEFEDPGAMGKTYLRKLKKSSLGAVPTYEQVTTAAEKLNLSMKESVDTLVPTNTDLVMKYNLFEVRLGHVPDESLVTKAIEVNPSHAFTHHFRDVMVGQPWSAELVKAAAKKMPDQALPKSELYSDQTWGKDIIETAAKNASPHTALYHADCYKTESYAEEVIKAAALASPVDALNNANKYSKQTWAADIIEKAARTVPPDTALLYAEFYKTKAYAKEIIEAAAEAAPGKALEHASSYSDQTWAGVVIETAAKTAIPEDALRFADRFKTEPYAEKIITTAAEAEPEKALEHSSQYSGQEWTNDIITIAAKKAPSDKVLNYVNRFISLSCAQEVITNVARKTPEYALAHSDSYSKQEWAKDVIKIAAKAAPPADALQSIFRYKNEPYAKDIMIEVATHIPDKTLEHAHLFADMEWADEVLEIAARKASHDAALKFSGHYKHKPFARDVFSAIGKASPDKALEHAHTYADQPWAGEIQELAAKHATESPSVDVDTKVRLAAKYIGQDWAEETITRIYQDKSSDYKPVLAILQNADFFEGRPWAEPIFDDIIREHSYEVRTSADKFLDQKAAQRIIERAVDYYPSGIDDVVKRVDQPWVEGLLRKILQNNPALILAYSEHFKDRPYAASVIKEAVDRAVEVSPSSILERIQLFEHEPWAKDAIRQAALKLSSEDEYSARSLLLKNADRIAGEDYGKDVITAAAKRSPAEALANSEKFSQYPWAAQVLTDAVGTIMRRSYGAGVLPHAALIKGKEFKHKRFLLGTRSITGEELIKRDAARDYRAAIAHADDYIDIPNGPEIVRKALRRSPTSVLDNGWSSSDGKNWHAEPWADAALEEAHRKSIRSDPEEVIQSLQHHSMRDRKWNDKLLQEAYVALAWQNPAKLLELADDDVPAKIIQDAYKRLKRRDPDAARKYEGLKALSDDAPKTGKDAVVQSATLSDDSSTHGQSQQDRDGDGAQEDQETHHHRDRLHQRRPASELASTVRRRQTPDDFQECVGAGSSERSSWDR